MATSAQGIPVKASYCRFVALTLVLLVGACTSTPPAPVVGRESPEPPADKTVTPEPSPTVLEPVAPEVAADITTPRERHPGAVALLLAAREAVVAGRYDTAGARIEQAMRIDSDDPWVWHELARLRFARGELAQAVATARRSNALRGASNRLMHGNLSLIAEAESRRGNTTASQEAAREARRYASDDGSPD